MLLELFVNEYDEPPLPYVPAVTKSVVLRLLAEAGAAQLNASTPAATKDTATTRQDFAYVTLNSSLLIIFAE
jgi:hypothetical protein